jgi:hypothetical protein
MSDHSDQIRRQPPELQSGYSGNLAGHGSLLQATSSALRLSVSLCCFTYRRTSAVVTKWERISLRLIADLQHGAAWPRRAPTGPGPISAGLPLDRLLTDRIEGRCWRRRTPPTWTTPLVGTLPWSTSHCGHLRPAQPPCPLPHRGLGQIEALSDPPNRLVGTLTQLDHLALAFRDSEFRIVRWGGTPYRPPTTSSRRHAGLVEWCGNTLTSGASAGIGRPADSAWLCMPGLQLRPHVARASCAIRCAAFPSLAC